MARQCRASQHRVGLAEVMKWKEERGRGGLFMGKAAWAVDMGG